MITKNHVLDYTFDEYEKQGKTKLSREILPVGTQVETLEGVYTCSEESRLAIDASGNVYPVANSIFEKSYKRKATEFEEQIAKLINSHSKENDSDTPDYVLAEYLNNCLETFNKAINA